MTETIDFQFRKRVYFEEPSRIGDVRDEYRRDKARIIHSSAFRRLQGKTQVMGVGEGDFHRTRLTHSIEAAQIGGGLVNTLCQGGEYEEVSAWLPTLELIEAACLAHDLGHPPFGHGGEKALHERMSPHGGFEGNGQTLRIISKLEKYHRNQGINPTKRVVLAVLKYALPYNAFPPSTTKAGPPKCYFNEEASVVEAALEAIPEADRERFLDMKPSGKKPKPQNMTLDASIMETADDIAYAVHDLEDIVARGLVNKDEVLERFVKLFSGTSKEIKGPKTSLKFADIEDDLFSDWSGDRKKVISQLVNFLISNMSLKKDASYELPLLAYKAWYPENIKGFLDGLKNMTLDLVVSEARVQQLERRGQRIVGALFDELMLSPKTLIPSHSWDDLDDSDCAARRVCDYIAGMTDSYAEKVYQRLFTPGYGSSRDEL